MVVKHRWLAELCAVALMGACNNGPELTGPPAVCHSAVQPLTLSVGQYQAIDPEPTDGCVIFPANASATDAEYVLVPQITTESYNFRTSFKLVGGVPVIAAPPLSAQYEEGPISPALQFHDRLRQLERSRGWGALAGLAPRAAPSRAQTLLSPPQDTLGNVRTFKVLSNLTSYTLQITNVPATAVSVGQHIALYVDNNAPANGLTLADFTSLDAVFDTLLYPTDTAAFGRESDIDGNGKVIVLMTNVVNQLVGASECTTSGYVGGFFFGADIDPFYATQFNNGEVFYSMIADSGATLSCSHSNSQVKRVVPVTFIHEFQHMISYNQHVLQRGGPVEVLWLNEGMSHYAEEMGGRAFLAGSGDSAQFCNFVRGDLVNLSKYWASPGIYPLLDTAGIGGLAERGAYWLFVRYLVDRFGADTSAAGAAALTRQIDQTATVGTANIKAVTGRDFASLEEGWALANWVSDLPGFTAPDSLKYKHWAFRTAYPTLYSRCPALLGVAVGFPSTFPLAALASAGPNIGMSGVMWSGSAGGYQRALQGPGAASYTLLLSDSRGSQILPILLPRLNVIRIK